jgi:hypothetical protein
MKSGERNEYKLEIKKGPPEEGPFKIVFFPVKKKKLSCNSRL